MRLPRRPDLNTASSCSVSGADRPVCAGRLDLPLPLANGYITPPAMRPSVDVRPQLNAGVLRPEREFLRTRAQTIAVWTDRR
jgi:hypothetical protein